jgi:hypothetical protein
VTVTVAEVSSRALRLCGQMGGPGRSMSSEEATECANFLNQTLDGWSAAQGMVYTQTIARHTLIVDQQSYTIGPSGADFTAARPVEIYNANIILTSADPEVRIPLAILDDDQYADMQVLDYGTNVPTYLYYNKNAMGSTLGTLTLIGYPTQANDLELFTQTVFNNNLATSDSVILPEGYIDAVCWTLAERIYPLYHKKGNNLLPFLSDQARKARANVVALNSKSPRQGSDAPSGWNNGNRGPFYSYLTGDGRPRR